jgi:hypothetical protein
VPTKIMHEKINRYSRKTGRPKPKIYPLERTVIRPSPVRSDMEAFSPVINLDEHRKSQARKFGDMVSRLLESLGETYLPR